MPEVHIFRQSQELGQLPDGNDQGDAREIAGHHLVRDELDQLAEAQHAKDELKQRRQQRGKRQQRQQTLRRQSSLRRHFNRHRGEHGRRRRARRGDEAAIAPDQRRDYAKCCSTEDASERTSAGVSWTERAVDQYAECNRRGQRDQHSREAAPAIAGKSATRGTRSVTHLSMARTAVIIQDEYLLCVVKISIATDFRKTNSVAIAVNADCRLR